MQEWLVMDSVRNGSHAIQKEIVPSVTVHSVTNVTEGTNIVTEGTHIICAEQLAFSSHFAEKLSLSCVLFFLNIIL